MKTLSTLTATLLLSSSLLLAYDEGGSSPYTTKFGSGAGAISTGYGNVFNGYLSGYSNTTGNYNVFNGFLSGYSNTTGNSNVFNGYQSGTSNTTGNSNVFNGYLSGYSNTTGYSNVFNGYKSGYYNTTGYSNVFNGFYSGYSNTPGSKNTFIGVYSGRNANINSSVLLGYQAGYSATRDNTLYIANSSTSSPLIYGEFDTGLLKVNGDFEVTGSTNITGDLTVETGGTLNVENISVTSNLTTSDITINGAVTNTSTFTSSGDMNITGGLSTQNILVGGVISSPSNTVVINSDLNVTSPVTAAFTGSNNKDNLNMFNISVENTNTAKKSDVGFALTNARGADGEEAFKWTFRTWEPNSGFVISKYGTGAKELKLYNTDPTDATTVVLELANGASNTGGQWLDASSRAYKENIKELDTQTAMEAFSQLKPVTYNYKNNRGEPVVGFIAEDVPDVVAVKDRNALSALEMVALLTKVVQAKDEEMTVMKEEISKLKSMQERVNHMEEILSKLD